MTPYNISRTNQFKKEFKLMVKRGKSSKKFEKILEYLIFGRILPIKYRDHKLVGSYEGSRELHIEPDWLLVYRIEDSCIILERTGSHSDLFK